MTEEFPSDTPSPNPAPDSSDDVAAETEVDALLAEAAELAAEVSDELEDIQPEGDDSAASQASASDNALVPEAGDVDAQLAALDALIDQASQEIGQQDTDPADSCPAEDHTTEVHTEEADSPSALPTDQQVSTTADSGDASAELTAPETEEDMQQAMDAIPDFMQDLTGPAEEKPASDTSSAQAPPTVASQDLAADGIPSSSVEATKDATNDAANDASKDVANDAAKTAEQELLATGRTRSLAPTTAPSADQDQSPTEQPSAKPSRMPSLHIPPKISEAAVSICDRAVTVLEMVDRPTERIGQRPRVVMGLVALATLGTAIIVFVASLF